MGIEPFTGKGGTTLSHAPLCAPLHLTCAVASCVHLLSVQPVNCYSSNWGLDMIYIIQSTAVRAAARGVNRRAFKLRELV